MRGVEITKSVPHTIFAGLLTIFIPLAAFGQDNRETLKQISIPDRVETRLGTLNFFDGLPGEIEEVK
jgi:hypothetical protein